MICNACISVDIAYERDRMRAWIGSIPHMSDGVVSTVTPTSVYDDLTFMLMLPRQPSKVALMAECTGIIPRRLAGAECVAGQPGTKILALLLRHHLPGGPCINCFFSGCLFFHVFFPGCPFGLVEVGGKNWYEVDDVSDMVVEPSLPACVSTSEPRREPLWRRLLGDKSEGAMVGIIDTSPRE